MNCPRCDHTVSDELRFCPFCGMPIGAAAEAAVKNDSENAPDPAVSHSALKTADRVWKKTKEAADAVKGDARFAAAAFKERRFRDLLRSKTAICCAAVLAAVILIVVVSSCAAIGASGNGIKGTYYLAKDGSEAVCLYNGDVIKGTDLSDRALIVASSLDGTVALLQDENELYILEKGKSALITDEYSPNSGNLSRNGKTAAYISDGTLYAYRGGKSDKISDIDTPNFTSPVISPDGGVVAFTNLDENAGVTGYAWKGGRLIDLETDIIPFSVSNGGKLIFGSDLSNNLKYIKNLRRDSDEKVDSFSVITAISTDHTELLYIKDGKTYCCAPSINPDDGIRIAKSVVSPLSELYYNGSVRYLDSFKRFYGKGNGALYEYSRKGESYDDEKIISDADDLVLSANQKSFVCIDDDNNVIKGDLSNARNAEKIGKDARRLGANDTLSSVFYIDDDNDLRYAGKSVKVASDAVGFVVTSGGVCVFYDDDDELYYSVRGGVKRKIHIDDAESLEIRNDIVYLVADGELYVSANGKSFKRTGVDVG